MQYFESGDSNFLIYLAYLADISAIYNTYSLRFQGQNTTIIETVNSMNALRACLVYWISKVKKNDFSMFPLLSEIVTYSDLPLPPNCLKTILAHLHNLGAEISQRFDEIKYASSLAWVIDPFPARPADVSYISNAAEKELIQLQTNSRAKQIFDAKGYVCLWMENNIISKTLSCSERMYHTFRHHLLSRESIQ